MGQSSRPHRALNCDMCQPIPNANTSRPRDGMKRDFTETVQSDLNGEKAAQDVIPHVPSLRPSLPQEPVVPYLWAGTMPIVVYHSNPVEGSGRAVDAGRQYDSELDIDPAGGIDSPTILKHSVPQGNRSVVCRPHNAPRELLLLPKAQSTVDVCIFVFLYVIPVTGLRMATGLVPLSPRCGNGLYSLCS